MRIVFWKSLSLIPVLITGMVLGSGHVVAQDRDFEVTGLSTQSTIKILNKHSSAQGLADCPEEQGTTSNVRGCPIVDFLETRVQSAGSQIRKKNGLYEVTPAQQKTLAQSLGLRQDPRCYSIRLTKTSRDWIVRGTNQFSVKNLDICDPSDGSYIYHKKNGSWVSVTGGSVMGCSTFKPWGELADAGASQKVRMDLRTAWAFCDSSF